MKHLRETDPLRKSGILLLAITALILAGIAQEEEAVIEPAAPVEDPVPSEPADAPMAEEPAPEQPEPEMPVNEGEAEGLEVPIRPEDPGDAGLFPTDADAAGVEGITPPVPAVTGSAKRDQVISLSPTFQPVPLQGITLIPDQRKRIGDVFTPSIQASAGFGTAGGLGEPPDMEELSRKMRQDFIGKPLTFGGLEDMVKAIETHYINNGRMLTHVFVPNQLMSDRILIAVLEGRVTKIDAESTVPENRGWWGKWYDQPYDLEDIAAELQDEVGGLDAMEPLALDQALVDLNTSPWARLRRPAQHPFRRISARYGPVDDLIGESEVTLLVEQERPLKFFLGYDDALTEQLGEDRIFAGAVWYDAFALNLDHQFAFQVFSGLDSDGIVGIAGSYVIPWKKWGMTTELLAAYSETEADVIAGGLPSTVTGENLILGFRHWYELPPLVDGGRVVRGDGASFDSEGRLDWVSPGKRDRQSFGIFHEVGLGIDYKAIGSTLEFGGSVVAPNDADLLQLVIGYNARQTDESGETNLGWTNVIGIGGSGDQELQAQRQGAESDYWYTRLDLRRDQDLPWGMLATGRLVGQYSSANLLQSEQLGIGGYNSVRGYSERAFRGDHGWLASFELYSPPLHPVGHLFSGLGWQDELRFLIFTDWGSGSAETEFAGDPFDDEQTLGSIGIGLRYDINDFFRLRVDYGIQLQTLPSPPYSGESGDNRLHVGLVVTF